MNNVSFVTQCFIFHSKFFMHIYNSYLLLYNWLKQEQYLGYDPYDALNTDLKIFKKNKYIDLYWTYINKFSPINLRPIFKIQKYKNNKAISLIILSILNYPPNDTEYSSILDEMIEYIISQSLVSIHGYHCWNANNIPIRTTREFQMPSVPGVIGTEICSSALKRFYDIKPSFNIKNIINSSKNYFLNGLLVDKHNHTFFRYKPISPNHELIYNASIIAASYVAKVEQCFRTQNSKNIIDRCYNTILRYQQPNGLWYYGINLDTGQEKNQVDFHQGYILDALFDYLMLYGNDKTILEAYLHGLEFYKSFMFFKNGQSLYRYPRKYPIDIKNQAQGIITFSKASKYDVSYLQFAKQIANWTINYMQDPSGYFYFLKYPLFTNKIPYIRWSQAWMLYALSHLLKAEEEAK